MAAPSIFIGPMRVPFLLLTPVCIALGAAVAGAATLGVTLLVGFYFLWIRGAGLLLVGILGVLAVVLYTRWLTHDPLLCLLP